ncbi:MAG: hypothetical protein IKV61_06795 [Clostridia bacterium]|nr:hypothetical protein [Clostridia bacterium]
MSKPLKVFKILTNALFVICAVIFTYLIVDVTSGILNNPSNEWGIVALLLFFIFAIPVTIYLAIYSIIMIVKKRYRLYDLIFGLIYIICYASLILVPLILNLI